MEASLVGEQASPVGELWVKAVGELLNKVPYVNLGPLHTPADAQMQTGIRVCTPHIHTYTQKKKEEEEDKGEEGYEATAAVGFTRPIREIVTHTV